MLPAPSSTSRTGCSQLAWQSAHRFERGKFWPFSSQILIGDQTQSNISRVTLEEVDGVWQGLAMPFLEGLDSGAVRLALSSEGHPWVGQAGRGWASKGGKLGALQRFVWDGVNQPFEIQDVSLRPNGFEITFTDRVSLESIKNELFKIESWFYEVTADYGSPRHELRVHETIEVEMGSLQKSVILSIADMRPNRIYGLGAKKVISEQGLKPIQGTAYYTAHRLPR